MPADSSAEQLRELHDAYVWKVNSAVGEGREDLVWQLVDDYTAEAMLLMTQEQGTRCGRPDCGICGQPRELPRRPPSRWGWLRRRDRRG